MSPKPRKPLDSNDDLANEFVFGATPPLPPPELQFNPVAVEGEDEDVIEVIEDEPPSPPRKPTKQPKAKPKTSKPTLKDRLMEAEKEPTVRLTVDMPQSMHRKLSILCAQTGKKKADIVRMLLGEALDEVED